MRLKKLMTVQVHCVEQTFLKAWIVMVEELDFFSHLVCGFFVCFLFISLVWLCFAAKLI